MIGAADPEEGRATGKVPDDADNFNARKDQGDPDGGDDAWDARMKEIDALMARSKLARVAEPDSRVTASNAASLRNTGSPPVGISVVGFHAGCTGVEVGGLEPVLQDLRQLSPQRAVDVGLAGVLDRIEARSALLAAQRVELLDGRRLANVVSKNRDIDVFGEAVDQTEPLG